MVLYFLFFVLVPRRGTDKEAPLNLLKKVSRIDSTSSSIVTQSPSASGGPCITTTGVSRRLLISVSARNTPEFSYVPRRADREAHSPALDPT
jgi:hypothetical protein